MTVFDRLPDEVKAHALSAFTFAQRNYGKPAYKLDCESFYEALVMELYAEVLDSLALAIADDLIVHTGRCFRSLTPQRQAELLASPAHLN